MTIKITATEQNVQFIKLNIKKYIHNKIRNANFHIFHKRESIDTMEYNVLHFRNCLLTDPFCE